MTRGQLYLTRPGACAVARVAVFDSGVGSLSVAGAVRRRLRCELVYFADLKNYPYGGRTRRQLARIIGGTLAEIRDRFRPDVTVMASNTPTLVLGEPPGVIGVHPPVAEAARLSRTGSIAVLAARSAARSRGLARYLSARVPPRVAAHKVDCSDLIDAVQSGRLGEARRPVAELGEKLRELGVDTATLSSTHLPFLRGAMEKEMPGVRFLDPADCVARRVASAARPSARASMRIYANADAAAFERTLRKLGLRRRVIPCS